MLALPPTPIEDSSLRVVAGTSRIAGVGPLERFMVEVQDGVPIDRVGFAARVDAILFDARGWTGGGRISLQRVDDPALADFRVTLALPAMVDRLCLPLHTAGTVSCANRGRSVINWVRWRDGASVPWGQDLAGYRTYVISHEVGHSLGHDHRRCHGAGRLAPVMRQQTFGRSPCRPNPWPLQFEQRRTPLPPAV